jgi:hypothetical protein
MGEIRGGVNDLPERPGLKVRINGERLGPEIGAGE